MNGNCYPAIEATDVTIAQLCRGRKTDHEEPRCLDHEGISYGGEMDPYSATQWAKILDWVLDDQRGALAAWVASGDYATIFDDSGLPGLGAFRESYVGFHDGFLVYAREMVDDLRILQGVSEEIARYCDVEFWARDVKFDYTVVDAVAGMCIFQA